MHDKNIIKFGSFLVCYCFRLYKKLCCTKNYAHRNSDNKKLKQEILQFYRLLTTNLNVIVLVEPAQVLFDQPPSFKCKLFYVQFYNKRGGGDHCPLIFLFPENVCLPFFQPLIFFTQPTGLSKKDETSKTTVRYLYLFPNFHFLQLYFFLCQNIK